MITFRHAHRNVTLRHVLSHMYMLALVCTAVALCVLVAKRYGRKWYGTLPISLPKDHPRPAPPARAASRWQPEPVTFPPKKPHMIAVLCFFFPAASPLACALLRCFAFSASMVAMYFSPSAKSSSSTANFKDSRDTATRFSALKCL